MNKKLIQDILITEDSLQHQLDAEEPQPYINSNLLRDSDIRLSTDIMDLEKEALDRLQKIRSRINQEEAGYTEQTLASTNIVSMNMKSKSEIDTDYQLTQPNQSHSKAPFSSQSLQRGRVHSGSSKNLGNTANIESTNTYNDQYYFKLPPKSSRNNNQASSSINDSHPSRAKSKEQNRSSVKFEDESDKQDLSKKQFISNDQKGSSSSLATLVNISNSKKSEKSGDSYDYSKTSQMEEDKSLREQKIMHNSQSQKNRQSSYSPKSPRQMNKEEQKKNDQNNVKIKKEKNQISKDIDRQIEDRLRKYEEPVNKEQLSKNNSSHKLQQQQQIQNSQQIPNYSNKQDDHAATDNDDSIDVAQIEKIQQKVTERKRSIDQINFKLNEKLNSPSSAIIQKNRVNTLTQTPQNNSQSQLKNYHSEGQLEEFYQTNRSPINANGLPPFPPQSNTHPFLTGQQNIPVSPNQFFSSVSSQHRLSTMVTQLTPNQQQQQQQLLQLQNHNFEKENQNNQSFNSGCSFSRVNTEKQINFNKKAHQFQSEHSTIKDETINLQEDTIQDLNRKLSVVSQQSKKQLEEIHQLKAQLQQSRQNITLRKNSDRLNTQASSMRISTTSSAKGLMQKSTKRVNQRNINIEGMSEDLGFDSSELEDDDISMAEENLDLKNEISQLKEKLEDKNIEVEKQSKMLLEQRNAIKKQEKEIEELKTKCKEYELGYANVEKEVKLIEKQYFIKRLQENNSLEYELYKQYNDELSKENSEMLQKAAKLLEKYKELEYEYKKLVSEQQEQQHWKSVVQQRDQELHNLNRELNYIKNNQLVELKEYKDIIDRLGTNLETHNVNQIVMRFIEVCTENKSHAEFQKQFYDIISSCQDPYQRKSQPLGVTETWELFKKIFQDYLDLRKKDRLDITLGNLLLKSLKVKTREEIVPEFTKKIMENEAYSNIIHKVKYHLKINHNCSLSELSESIDQILSKKLYYK